MEILQDLQIVHIFSVSTNIYFYYFLNASKLFKIGRIFIVSIVS